MIHPIVQWYILGLGIYGVLLLGGAAFIQWRRAKKRSATILGSASTLLLAIILVVRAMRQ